MACRRVVAVVARSRCTVDRLRMSSRADIAVDRRPAPDNIAAAVVAHCRIENLFVQPSVVDSSAVVRIHHCGM